MADSRDDDDPYAAIVEYYDLEHDEFDDDLALYLNSASAIGDPVLDIGCGTGRIAWAIAEAGFRVVGIDISEPMLAAARSKPIRARGNLLFVNGAMEVADESPGGPFGLAIISLNGLLHASSQGRQREALKACRNALDPRGQLIFDVLNPTAATLRGFDQSAILEGVWISPNGDQIQKFSSRRIDATRQEIDTRIWYDRTDSSGSVTRLSTHFVQRYLYPAEIELLLELSGFAEWQMYGSYEFDPLTDESERIIVTAEPTPSR